MHASRKKQRLKNKTALIAAVLVVVVAAITIAKFSPGIITGYVVSSVAPASNSDSLNQTFARTWAYFNFTVQYSSPPGLVIFEINNTNYTAFKTTVDAQNSVIGAFHINVSNESGVEMVGEDTQSNGISNLALLLHLNENSGDVANDSSTLNNDGYTTSSKWISSRLTRALLLNGTGDNIKVNYSNTLNVSNQFTIELWINGSNLNKSAQALVSRWEPGSGNFTHNRSSGGLAQSWQVMNASQALGGGRTWNYRGFKNAVFDGKHVYFISLDQSAGGQVTTLMTRYDTTGSFTRNVTDTITSHASWQAMNSSQQLNSLFNSYTDGVFDGRYVYFTGDFHGILRYDTTGNFTHNQTDTVGGNPSWQAIRPGVTLNSEFSTCGSPAFDGKFVYFDCYGYILRYDTTKNFTHNNSADPSWQVMNAHINLTPHANGTAGTAFDGRYVYFVPSSNDVDYHGNIVRYDTTGNFTHNSSNSWQLMNMTETLHVNFNGYDGAVFDGRHVYFMPNNNVDGNYHANVVRYDTTGSFNANRTDTVSGTPSWQVANLTEISTNSLRRFSGGAFDGRYVYIVPDGDNNIDGGFLARYDTTGNFTHNSTNTEDGNPSWQVIELNRTLNNHYRGYTGAVFDGRYVYIVPQRNGVSQDTLSGQHGHILRYDSAGANSSYAFQLASEADNGGRKPAGTTIKFTNGTHIFSLSAGNYTSLNTSGWNHIAATYNGNNLTIYVNGANVTSKGTRNLNLYNSTADLIIGALVSKGTNNTTSSWFNGSIDEVVIWNRSLSAAEIANHYRAQSPISLGNHTFRVYANDSAGGAGVRMTSTEANPNWFNLGGSTPTINCGSTADLNVTVTRRWASFNCTINDSAAGLSVKYEINTTAAGNLTPEKRTGFYIMNGTADGVNFPDQGSTSGWMNMSGNVLLFHLDETSGQNAVDNSSAAQTNNGTVSGALTNGSGRMLSGGGWALNGTGDNIKVNASNSINVTSAFSIELWVNASNAKKGSQALVSKWDAGSGNFTHNVSNSWQNVDTEVDLNPEFLNVMGGYVGAAFDGRYVYFVHYSDGVLASKVLRYDTLGNFSTNSSRSWETMNIATFNSNFVGYQGATFDGRYVYFVPARGAIVRHDTTGNFTHNRTDTANGRPSWEIMAANDTLNSAFTNFWGAVFDGQYVYFVQDNGEHILRYNTLGNFTNNVSNSWEAMTFDTVIGGSDFADGRGGIFDGRYVYFALSRLALPEEINVGHILRYDTTGNFTHNQTDTDDGRPSWQIINAAHALSGTDASHTFWSGAFDGRYVYFTSNSNGNIARHDTTGNFTHSSTDTISGTSSWQIINLSSISTNYGNGYGGAIFDGRYVYLVPHTGVSPSTIAYFLRYDTTGNFTNNTANTANGLPSWQAIQSDGLSGVVTVVYRGGVFDGRYVYYVPWTDSVNFVSTIPRYDSAGSNSSYALEYTTVDRAGGFAGGPFGITAKFANATSLHVLSSNNYNLTNSSSWHHVAVTYDGNNLTLYVDGLNVSSKGAVGSVRASPADLITGAMTSKGTNNTTSSWFNGTMDEIAVWNRSLSAEEIKNHYSTQTPVLMGNHTFVVYARNAFNVETRMTAGSSSVNWFQLSTAAPEQANAIPIVIVTAPANNTTIRSSFPNITVNVTDTQQASTYVEIITNVSGQNNKSYGMVQNNTLTNMTWTNGTATPDGIYIYYARAYDNTSNNVSEGNLTLIINTSGNAPTVTINNASNISVSSSTPIISITVTDPEQASTYAEIFANGTNKSYALVQNNTATSMSWSSTSDGIYSYYARAYDNSTNLVSSSNVTLVVDTTKPTIANVSSMLINQSIDSSNWTANFSITDNLYLDNYSIEINGTNYTFSRFSSFSSYDFSSSNANYTVNVYANDSAGNYESLRNSWIHLNATPAPPQAIPTTPIGQGGIGEIYEPPEEELIIQIIVPDSIKTVVNNPIDLAVNVTNKNNRPLFDTKVNMTGVNQDWFNVDVPLLRYIGPRESRIVFIELTPRVKGTYPLTVYARTRKAFGNASLPLFVFEKGGPGILTEPTIIPIQATIRPSYKKYFPWVLLIAVITAAVLTVAVPRATWEELLSMKKKRKKY